MIPLKLLRKPRPVSASILPWATQQAGHRARIQGHAVLAPGLDLRLLPLKGTKASWTSVFTAFISETAFTLGSVVLFNLSSLASHSKFLLKVGGI